MIVTVTANPGVDKRLIISGFCTGATNRGRIWTASARTLAEELLTLPTAEDEVAAVDALIGLVERRFGNGTP